MLQKSKHETGEIGLPLFFVRIPGLGYTATILELKECYENFIRSCGMG